MNVRVSLDRYLLQNKLTAYRLSKEVAGKAAQGSVYALARGEKVKRVDLETLSQVMQALTRLTGQPVTPNDLLEVIEEPVEEMDAEAKAWLQADLAPPLEPYDWGDIDPSTLGRPVTTKGNVILVHTNKP